MKKLDEQPQKMILDDFEDEATLREIVKQWPKEGWKSHEHEKSKSKKSMGYLHHMPKIAIELLLKLNNQATLNYLSRAFNRDLIPDPWITMQAHLFGGGLHEIGTDGFLGMHVDYNWHPTKVYRRLNLLLYLNDWKEGDGGELVIGEEIIQPIFNRCVVFETTETSWHGHPNPWKGKDSRKSLAVYYYSAQGEAVKPHSTIYK